jgi:hypothetical protein
MRLNRAAADGAQTAGVARRRLGAGAIRVLSVTAVAAAACTLWAGAASAATTAPAAGGTTTTTAITNAADGTVTSGGAFTFDVTVSGTDPTGEVGVTAIAPAGLGTAYSCSFDLTASDAGSGSCTIHPPAFGVVEYQAVYAGDETYAGSTSKTYDLAVQNPTTTTVGPATAKAGQVTLVATILAAGANISEGAGGTGSVAFYNGTAVIKGCGAAKITNPSGGADNLADCTTTFGAGNYTITAKYSGDTVNVASQGSQTLTVAGTPPPVKHATKTHGSASPKNAKVRHWVTLSSTVTSSGGTPGGKITFMSAGRVLCTARLSHGKAHCSYKFKAVGTHRVRAWYAGSSTFDKSHSAFFAVKVKK